MPYLLLGLLWLPNLPAVEPATPWWSLKPLTNPPIPRVRPPHQVRTPIDAFLLAKLDALGLQPNAEADRRTLLRRLSFDLLGLPPTPQEIADFENDPRPDAYERQVERLLHSPHYGERWARHWLDVVHYGDTHGYDKDKLRPNAWPYRDWVVRAFNDDKPFARFVREQIAGDVFYPGTADGVIALGMVAAGPWDFVGQVELREGTLDKAVTRNLDRDDMVAVVLNTFVGLTVQCARCHDHKFDPISQEEYYRLQAVFAGVDRAERSVDMDPTTARRRSELLQELERIEKARAVVVATIERHAGPEPAELTARLARLGRTPAVIPPEYGWHSAVSADQATRKWVQLDLGEAQMLSAVELVGCHDSFNNIGAGFGFPVRFRIDGANEPTFAEPTLLVDRTHADVPNPGIVPLRLPFDRRAFRFIRITATKLAPRQNDFIFALAEAAVFTADGRNVAAGAKVTALDSIDAPPRWRRSNLTDGLRPHYSAAEQAREAAELTTRIAQLQTKVEPKWTEQLATLAKEESRVRAELARLPSPQRVYSLATDFPPQGNFTPTKGRPRPIFVLRRGSEKSPLNEVGPGTIAAVGLPATFALPPNHPEGARRAALADWILEPRNPLTWRVIVNRIWHYHFGSGIVDTPNDFGKMGNPPSNPELLDWLATWFRDGERSFRDLHRLIVCSAAYRRASTDNPAAARIDADNRFLWRQNRRKLDAESLRDAVLTVAGRLDPRLGGPGYRPFGFRDDHSPHYLYDQFDPDDPAARRRSLYRFLVRSVPEPFAETLDCADPSLQVEKRNETLTALQALTLLNNRFMIRMAEHFAERIMASGDTDDVRLRWAFAVALGRAPTEMEAKSLLRYTHQYGWVNTARIVFNLNEFAFVD